jgi:hypothetical protein
MMNHQVWWPSCSIGVQPNAVQWPAHCKLELAAANRQAGGMT